MCRLHQLISFVARRKRKRRLWQSMYVPRIQCSWHLDVAFTYVDICTYMSAAEACHPVPGAKKNFGSAISSSRTTSLTTEANLEIISFLQEETGEETKTKNIKKYTISPIPSPLNTSYLLYLLWYLVVSFASHK